MDGIKICKIRKKYSLEVINNSDRKFIRRLIWKCNWSMQIVSWVIEIVRDSFFFLFRQFIRQVRDRNSTTSERGTWTGLFRLYINFKFPQILIQGYFWKYIKLKQILHARNFKRIASKKSIAEDFYPISKRSSSNVTSLAIECRSSTNFPSDQKWISNKISLKQFTFERSASVYFSTSRCLYNKNNETIFRDNSIFLSKCQLM